MEILNLTINGASVEEQECNIASAIKAITYEEAVRDYGRQKRNTDKLISSGYKCVNYFIFSERLRVIGKRGNLTFYDFVSNCLNEPEMFLSQRKFISFIKYQRAKGQTLIQSLYHYYCCYYSAVSVFAPSISVYIYNKYKPITVLDHTMGWGGRLLGACSSGVINYIGIDINTNLQFAYERMKSFVIENGSTTNLTLLFKDALEVDYSTLTYDMVFTSPPYYNTELYRGTKRRSIEEWETEFYIPLITNTYKHLQPNGFYILNFPLKIYERVCVPLLGEAQEMIDMPATKRRQLSSKLSQSEYKEKIYVWQKVADYI